MSKLENKVAVITGGAGGIGGATAKLFANEGARVVVADYNLDGAERVAKEINDGVGVASACKVDVSKAESCAAMIAHTIATFGQIDILMNNAGIASARVPLHETAEADWDRVVDVDLKGVFLGMKYALPHMIERKIGTIICVASISGMISAPGMTPYACAKAGVIQLTRNAAAEYSRYNIRVNALAPGWTRTAIVDDFVNSGVPEEKLIHGIPVRRLGEVDEIAQAALFLAGDDARFVQGTTLVIDGGITMV